MQQMFTGEELRRMRELATKGGTDDDRLVDVEDLTGELELIHMTDVVEMQRLLARAADELERLYGRQ